MTTPELHELAKDPQAFDTVMAKLHGLREGQVRTVESFTSKLHQIAGDKKSYRNTRVPVWGMSDLEVTRAAQRRAAHGDDREAGATLGARAVAQAMLDAYTFELDNMNAVYLLQGNRWTRFFPSITKSHPHIHRSLNCRTLHADTLMSWAPELSGRTDAEAVDELDEALCTVCFPDAPVALHEYVSRKSQAEQAERAAEKDERAAKRAAKTLTEDEQRTMGRDHHGDRVTTVAKLKEIVRYAPSSEVEQEFWNTHSPEGWDVEHLARRRSNMVGTVAAAREAAAKAKAILMARERAHAGWGADWDQIARMEDSARKSATREWNRV